MGLFRHHSEYCSDGKSNDRMGTERWHNHVEQGSDEYWNRKNADYTLATGRPGIFPQESPPLSLGQKIGVAMLLCAFVGVAGAGAFSIDRYVVPAIKREFREFAHGGPYSPQEECMDEEQRLCNNIGKGRSHRSVDEILQDYSEYHQCMESIAERCGSDLGR